MDLRLFDGAYYLGGYAVECALKACIAKTTRRHEFPEKDKVNRSYSHNLRELVRVAGLEDDHASRVKADPKFERFWDTVEIWSEQSRYRRHSARSAEELLTAVANKQNGVIAWIAPHW